MYTFSSKANEKAYKSIAGRVSNYVKRRRGREQEMGYYTAEDARRDRIENYRNKQRGIIGGISAKRRAMGRRE